jgi:hypothetical protein
MQSFTIVEFIAASFQKVFTARQSAEKDEKQFLAGWPSMPLKGKRFLRGFAYFGVFWWPAAVYEQDKASTRLGNPGFHSLRSRPVVAATAKSYQRDAKMYSDQSPRMPYTQELVTYAEYLNDVEVRSDHTGNNSISSFPSSISAPTRDWVSAAGSQYSLKIPKKAVNVVEYRDLRCLLCFNPALFLLGMEIRQLAQQQRDQKSRDPLARREFPAFTRSAALPPISSLGGTANQSYRG